MYDTPADRYRAEADLSNEIATKLAAYEEARAAHRASPDDADVQARWAAAQADVHEFRKYWRSVGEAAGLRTPIPVATSSQEG